MESDRSVQTKTWTLNYLIKCNTFSYEVQFSMLYWIVSDMMPIIGRDNHNSLFNY